jgi:hypothetical protein
MEQADETVARDFASGRKTEQRRDRFLADGAARASQSARSLFVRRQAQNPRIFFVQHLSRRFPFNEIRQDLLHQGGAKPKSSCGWRKAGGKSDFNQHGNI